MPAAENVAEGEPIDIEARLDAVAMGPQLESGPAVAEIDRDALLLFAWAGLSYDDIAVATDVPVGTVRSRIHRRHRQKVRERPRCARPGREHGMSDLELELLRAWAPDPVAASPEVREHAPARLVAAYDGVVTETPARVRNQFVKRIAVAAIVAAVLVGGAIVWVQRQADDRFVRSWRRSRYRRACSAGARSVTDR